MSDRRDAVYRRGGTGSRRAWKGVGPHLPPRVARAIAAPAKSALHKGNGYEPTTPPVRATPHLVRTRSGEVFLVEGMRRRNIGSADGRAALERSLGRAL